jgi:hypothetical protein
MLRVRSYVDDRLLPYIGVVRGMRCEFFARRRKEGKRLEAGFWSCVPEVNASKLHVTNRVVD